MPTYTLLLSLSSLMLEVAVSIFFWLSIDDLIFYTGNVPIYMQKSCDPGWTWYNGQCYFFSSDKQNYTDAMANCTALGAQLAVLSTQAKNNFVVDHMIGSYSNFTGGSFWIGLYQPTKLSPFVWVDRGVPVTYTNYHCNEPNDAGAGEDCIEMYISNQHSNSGTWNDNQCSSTAWYMCEKVAPPTTQPPSKALLPHPLLISVHYYAFGHFPSALVVFFNKRCWIPQSPE